MSDNKLTVDDTVLGVAASVAGRACELLADGWVKGKLYDGPGGVSSFCIHGAINLAIEEVFGDGASAGRSHIDGTRMISSGASDVEAVAVAFIIDEAAAQHKYKGGGMFLGAAAFNDAPERKHEEVLSVVGNASKRLWDLSMEQQTDGAGSGWTPSKWAEVDVSTEEAKNYLYATLN